MEIQLYAQSLGKLEKLEKQEETLNRTGHTVYAVYVPPLLATTRVHQCFKRWASVSVIHTCVPVLRLNKGYV